MTADSIRAGEAGRRQHDDSSSERGGGPGWLAQAAIQCGGKIKVLNRLDQISLRAHQDRFSNQLRIILGRTHDHLQAGLKRAQMLQGLKPIHSRHLHIEQDNGRGATIAQALETLFSVVGDLDTIVIEFEKEAQVALHLKGILNQQNRSFRRLGFGG